MKALKRGLQVVVAVMAIAILGFFIFAPSIVEKGRNAVVEHDPYPVSPEGAALHAELFVGDWHADTMLWNRDLLDRASYGQVDLPRLIEGNVGFQVFTSVTKSPAGQNYEENSADTLDNITLLAVGQLWPVRTWSSLYERAAYQGQKLHNFAKGSDGQLRVIKTRADFDALLNDRANGEVVVGGLLGIEGAHALEGSIENFDRLHDEGYRLVGLHHFFDNELGGSLHGIGNQGLTDFGREVVARAIGKGWIVDLAHSSPQVARDVLEMTDIPLVVSHGGLHGHCPVRRNFEDDLMQAIAATGGVVGMGYWADVTCGAVTPDGIAEMIAKAVETLGEDHVSLGSDFDGSVTTGFDTSELAALTSALLARGLTAAQIAKIMGGNLARVVQARLR